MKELEVLLALQEHEYITAKQLAVQVQVSEKNGQKYHSVAQDGA